jgi:hypothetical protein
MFLMLLLPHEVPVPFLGMNHDEAKEWQATDVTYQARQRVEERRGRNLFGDRADEGKAVGRAHSGDIVPAGAGGQG